MLAEILLGFKLNLNTRLVVCANLLILNSYYGCCKIEISIVKQGLLWITIKRLKT